MSYQLTRLNVLFICLVIVNIQCNNAIMFILDNNFAHLNIDKWCLGGVRSARYRPHGYKPPPTRKMSPASGGPARKSSTDSLKFNGE